MATEGSLSENINCSQVKATRKNKIRSINWTNEEICTLVNALEPCYDKLYGAFSSTVTQEYKNSTWAVIEDEVNSCSVAKRDLQHIKDKVKDLKSRTKALVQQKLKSCKKTGGGEADDITMTAIEEKIADLTLWQKKIARLIGVTGLTGIKGGIDVNKPNTSNQLCIMANTSTSKKGASFQSENGDASQTENRKSHFTESHSQEGPTNSSKSEKSPKITKKAASKADVSFASDKLLDIQKEILCGIKRIASALEERNSLKKFKLGLDPTTPFPVTVTNNLLDSQDIDL